MADRYWRGGTGSWTTTNTANWSTTSGGAGGASVPTFADRVFFDQAGTYTVTLTGSLSCAGITVSAGTVTFTSTGSLNIYGSMSLIAGTVWSANNTISFLGAGAGNTIQASGVSFAAPITIAGGAMGATTGIWGTYTLQSSLTTTTLSLSSGRLNTGGYTLSVVSLSHGGGCIDFGSPVSTITLTANGGISLNSDANRSWVGRPNIISTSTSAATPTVTANGAVGSLTIAGGATLTSFTVNGGIFSSITHTRTVAFSISFGTTYPVILESWGLAGVSAGSRLTVSGTVYLMSRPASGVAAYLSSTLNCYGCPIYADTGSTVTGGYGVFASAWQAPVTPKYWVGGAGDWSNTAKWSTTSGGVGGTAIPWADEDVIFDANSGATAFTITTGSAKLAHRDFTCTRSNITLSTYGSHLTNIVITGNINSLTAYNPGSYFNGITVWGGTGPKTYVGNSLFLQNAGGLHLIGSSYTFSQATTILANTILYNGSFNPGIYTITWGAAGAGAGFYTHSGDAKAWNNGSSTTRTNLFRNYAPFNTTIQTSTANIIFATDTGTTFDLGINNTWGGSFTILASGGGQDAYFTGVNSTISNVIFTTSISGTLSFYGGITIAGGNLIGSIGTSFNFSLYTGSYLTVDNVLTFTGSTNVSLAPPSWVANFANVTFSNSGYTRFYFPASAATTILGSQNVVFNITPSFNLQTGNTASTAYSLPPSATYNAGCNIIYASSVNAEVTVTIPAATIAGTLAITNSSSTYSGIVSFAGNVTANTAITNSTLNPGARIVFKSSVAGTQRTLSTPSITLSNINFQDIFASGAAIPWSGSSFGNLGNNTNITFSAPRNVYWNLAGAQNWTANGWAATSGGVPATSNYPLPQDTAVFDDAGAMGTVSLINTVQVTSINASARTLAGTLSAASSQTLNFTSSIVLGTGLTNLANIVFTSITSPTTFTSAGRTIASLVANSSVTLNDAMIASAGITVNSPATLNTQGYNVTTGNLVTVSGTTVNGGSGASPTLTLTGTGTSIAGAVSGSVFNVVVNSTGATNIFRPAGSQVTYGTFTWTNTTASATTTIGGGLFTTVSRTGTAAQTIRFNPTYAFSCTDFNLTGSLGNVLTLNSLTAGTAASVNISSGNFSAAYLSVKDIAFTPAPAANGSTPYVLYAGSTSTSLGNVTGLLFQNGGVGAPKAYLITTTGAGTWTVPSDWNSSSNTIHLVGGGGGGGGGAQFTSNNRAGGGGGGGGCTVVVTYPAAAGASVSFTVGAGGTAGALGFSTGGTGGTTSWSGYTATGGTGGSSAIGSPGGNGGSGNFTGGKGGNGANTSSTWAGVGSGGGGGAAGPGYGGKNGGNGFASTTFNPGGGGGGGGAGGALSTAGSNATSSSGGAGGQGPAGTGGGTSGSGAGSNGGGGGGGGTGGVGGASTTIAGSFGPSGGPGGTGGTGGTAGVAGTWGAGGSGGAPGTSSGNAVGGAGGQGFIFIFYTPPAGTVYTGTVTETATYADLAYAAFLISRTIAETATGTDAVFRTITAQSTIAETATSSDAITASGQFVSFLTDTATYSDVTTANNLLTVSVSDAATYSDSVVVQAGLTAAVLDTAMYSETIRATATFFAVAQEQGTGLDAMLAKVQFLSSVVNTATVSDVDFALAVWATSVADSALVVGSAAVAASVFNPVVLQPATALDTPSASHVMIAQSIDNMAISDLMSARFLWEPIDDSQTVVWQNVSGMPSTTWAPVNDGQSATWTQIAGTTTTWSEIDDSGGGTWNGIPTN